ncbi:hypothetical protein [Bacillus thuringiensis]|uniref:Uncharacterized protein n=1 Tax=Bacillus thuringiensis subsp. jegathesan TaxID=56955 RepID=A0A9X6R632_BACTJ|nr:hypothetical protein [Bacillus thuringiensis]OUB78418.1 hypothetical protein BK750_00065 [Bacillus thuringiensis serovar jegathesan]
MKLSEQREKALSHWKFNLSIGLNNEEGFYISLDDWLTHDYYKIKSDLICGGCRIYNSGDGLRAYLWLETYLDLIQSQEFIPKFIDILCYEDYQKELMEMFEKHNSISEDTKMLTALGRIHKLQNNSVYTFEVLEELKNVLKSKNIPFRQITLKDMRVAYKKERVE